MSDEKVSKTTLVNIARGTWVDPSTVKQIVAWDGREARTNWWGREVDAAVSPSVVVMLTQQTLVFSYKTINEASDAADNMADIVNGIDDEPEDPDREDIPKGRNVVSLVGKAA